MTAKSKKKTRVTLDLNPEFYRRLNELEELVDAGSKSNVIREALKLYEFVAKRTAQGHKFLSVDPDGVQERFVFLGPRVE